MAGKVVSFFVLSFFLTTSLYLSGIIASPEDLYVNNEKGVEALKFGRYRQAIEYFMRALSSDTDNEAVKNNLSSAYNSLGSSFLRKGEPYNAVDNFERALFYKEDNSYSLISLGRIYYEKNNLEKAIYFLEQAYKINPGIKGLKALLDKARRETAVEDKLTKFESSHFLIVSAGETNVENLANIRITLEQAYSRVGSFLGYFPKHKTTVVLYPEELYKRATGAKPYWSHAVFDGKIRIPLAKKIYSKDFLSQIIYHEYAHVIIRDLAGGNCPVWLNEGIACYAEGLVNHRDRSFFTQFISENSFVAFENLPDSYNAMGGVRQANLYYREFYLLASFIADKFSYGAFKDILEELGSGSGISEALRKSTGLKMERFADSWHRYVKMKLGF